MRVLGDMSQRRSIEDTYTRKQIISVLKVLQKFCEKRENHYLYHDDSVTVTRAAGRDKPGRQQGQVPLSWLPRWSIRQSANRKHPKSGGLSMGQDTIDRGTQD